VSGKSGEDQVLVLLHVNGGFTLLGIPDSVLDQEVFEVLSKFSTLNEHLSFDS